jgi:NAD(P)H-quinone oxidoreductase subunit 5
LLVGCVVLKTAQLPFHGWLTQVMEAPTPVSALLHAGVVNLGGMVLIKLSALWSVVPLASWLLVLWGGLTAGLACWVMQTRISIKLRLAWSTCAQMGFMLMECGLGQYSLALLHLVTHSIYKAHAFLSSGSQVRATIRQSASPASTASCGIWPAAWPASRCCWPACKAGSWHWAMPCNRPAADCGHRPGPGPAVPTQPARLCPGAAAMPGVPAAAHPVCHPAGRSGQRAAWLPAAGCGLFLALFLLQGWIATPPGHALTQRLYALAFGGLYLDEWWLRTSMRTRLYRLGRLSQPRQQGATAHDHA